jgi:hypothetical protein
MTSMCLVVEQSVGVSVGCGLAAGQPSPAGQRT